MSAQTLLFAELAPDPLLSFHFGLITLNDWHERKWLFILAILLPYVVIFIPHILWKVFKAASDLHFNQTGAVARLQGEKSNIEATLKELTESGPNIVLREPAARHIETISFNDGRVVIFTAQFIKVRFVNKPVKNSPNAMAQGVSAKIKFFNKNNELVLEMDGRWDNQDQPSLLHPTQSKRNLLLADFTIEEERNLDIAFLSPSSSLFVAFNNDNYNYQNLTKPEHILQGDHFTAEIRLVAVQVDATYSIEFRKSGLRGNIEIVGELLEATAWPT